MNEDKITFKELKKYIIFMQIAKNISKMSYDPKHKVGAILAKNNFSNINAIGYNGNYKGGPNERDSLESGMSGFIHAEENVLMKSTLSDEEKEKYTLYVTMTPCHMCAKKIVTHNIKRIIFYDTYLNAKDSLEILNSSDVEIIYLIDVIHQYLIDNIKSENDLDIFISNMFDSEMKKKYLNNYFVDFNKKGEISKLDVKYITDLYYE